MYNELRWSCKGQVSVLSFPEVWYQLSDSEGIEVCEENPNQEYEIGARQAPRLPVAPINVIMSGNSKVS